MSQQVRWEKEYTTSKGIPTTTRTTPSSSVTEGLTFLQENNLLTGKKVVDLGCGAGRNSLYLAKNGFKVTAVDFAQSALDVLNKKAKDQKLSKNIKTVNASIGKKLPLKDDSFDLAIDIVSSLSLNNKEINIFEKEVQRILKPNGFLISYNLNEDDEFYLKFGKNKGHYLAPKTKLLEYCRSKQEILDVFKDWELMKFKIKEKTDNYYGKIYTRRLMWLILKNSTE